MKNERYTTNPTTINYEYDSFLINDLNLNLLFNNNSNNPSLIVHEKQENKGNDISININNKNANGIKSSSKSIRNNNNNVIDDYSVNTKEYTTNKLNSKQQNSIYLSSLNSENLFDTQLLTQLNINQLNKNKYLDIDTRRNSKEHIINHNDLRNNNIEHRIDHGSTRRNSKEHIVKSNSIKSNNNKESINISNSSPNLKKLSNNYLSNLNSNSILDTQLLSELYDKQHKYSDDLNKVIKPKAILIKEKEFKDLTLNSILNKDKFDINTIGIIKKDVDNKFNKLSQNEISTGVKPMAIGINNNKEKKKLRLFNQLNKNSNPYQKGNPNIQKENINNINVDIKQKKNSIIINEINSNNGHGNENPNNIKESLKMNYNTQQKEKFISTNKINKKQDTKQKSNQNSEKENMNMNMNINNNKRESENLIFNNEINDKYNHNFQEIQINKKEIIPINNIKEEEKKKEVFTIPNNNALTFELQLDQRKLHYQKIITQLEKMNISNQDLKDELKINKYKKLIELLNKINLNSIINLNQYDLLKHQLILDKFNKFKNVIESNGKEEGNMGKGSGSGKSNSRSSLKDEGNNRNNIKDNSNNSIKNIDNSNNSIKNSDNTSSFKSNNKNHIKNKVKLLKLPIPKSKDEYEYINKNHIKINCNNNNNIEINNSNKNPNLLNSLISKGNENEKDRSKKNDVIINDYESMNSNLCFLNLSVTKFEDGNNNNNNHLDFKNQNNNLNQQQQYNNNIKNKNQDKDKDKDKNKNKNKDENKGNEVNTELLNIYEEISIDYLNNINPINNPLNFNSNIEAIKNILLNIQFQLINMDIIKENKRDNIKEMNKLMKKLELIHELLVKL